MGGYWILAAVCILGAVLPGESANTTRSIPSTLSMGVATAAYQVEGAWNVSGKGVNIWDKFVRIPGKIVGNATGDDACKSYDYYERDIEMLKWLGVNHYRMSIAWTRVLPNGFANNISETGITYYNNVIDALIAANITPYVTIYHWDLPQNLQDLGGFASPYLADWLEDYARVLFDNFGDRVKSWATFNEPNKIVIDGYGETGFAPGIGAHGVGEYLATRNMLLAHARVWHLYDEEYRATQNGQVGIVFQAFWDQGVTSSESDAEAASVALAFDLGLYANAIFTTEGGFPQTVIDIVANKSEEQGYTRSRLVQFDDDEIEYIKGTGDFFGINYYFSANWTYDNYTYGETYSVPSIWDDIGAVNPAKDKEVDGDRFPTGIKYVIDYIKENYQNPDIKIMENGYIATTNDSLRLNYYKKYLYSVLDSIEDGANVTAYTIWSLMDNFAWSNGYSRKLGLFDVDFTDENRTRTARQSAFWFKETIANQTLNLDSYPEVTDVTF